MAPHGQLPGSAAASGSAAVFRSTAADRGGGAETACSDAVRAIDPKLFSPGSCMSCPPTRGDQHETVFLDAGHGG